MEIMANSTLYLKSLLQVTIVCFILSLIISVSIYFFKKKHFYRYLLNSFILLFIFGIVISFPVYFISKGKQTIRNGILVFSECSSLQSGRSGGSSYYDYSYKGVDYSNVHGSTVYHELGDEHLLYILPHEPDESVMLGVKYISDKKKYTKVKATVKKAHSYTLFYNDYTLSFSYEKENGMICVYPAVQYPDGGPKEKYLKALKVGDTFDYYVLKSKPYNHAFYLKSELVEWVEEYNKIQLSKLQK